MELHELRQLVREIAEEVLEESSKRQDYLERIFDVAKGAMGEWMKARYAETNATKRRKAGPGTSEWWDREARKILRFQLYQAARRRLKGGGQKAAFLEAVEDLRDVVPGYLRWAKHEVAEAFDLDERDLDDPPDASTDEFFALLENEFDSIWA